MTPNEWINNSLVVTARGVFYRRGGVMQRISARRSKRFVNHDAAWRHDHPFGPIRVLLLDRQ